MLSVVEKRRKVGKSGTCGRHTSSNSKQVDRSDIEKNGQEALWGQRVIASSHEVNKEEDCRSQ